MEENRVLTCVYCGVEYPQDTPAWGDKVLTDHIKVCPKHPMRKAEENIQKLRKALSDLVGVYTHEELTQMESTLRSLMAGNAAPTTDIVVAINAVNALLETE